MVEGLARVVVLLPAAEAAAAGVQIAQPIVERITQLTPQACGRHYLNDPELTAQLGHHHLSWTAQNTIIIFFPTIVFVTKRLGQASPIQFCTLVSSQLKG